jgi:hypothetical protein
MEPADSALSIDTFGSKVADPGLGFGIRDIHSAALSSSTLRAAAMDSPLSHMAIVTINRAIWSMWQSRKVSGEG